MERRAQGISYSGVAPRGRPPSAPPEPSPPAHPRTPPARACCCAAAAALTAGRALALPRTHLHPPLVGLTLLPTSGKGAGVYNAHAPPFAIKERRPAQPAFWGSARSKTNERMHHARIAPMFFPKSMCNPCALCVCECKSRLEWGMKEIGAPLRERAADRKRAHTRGAAAADEVLTHACKNKKQYTNARSRASPALPAGRAPRDSPPPTHKMRCVAPRVRAAPRHTPPFFIATLLDTGAPCVP